MLPQVVVCCKPKKKPKQVFTRIYTFVDFNEGHLYDYIFQVDSTLYVWYLSSKYKYKKHDDAKFLAVVRIGTAE